MKLIALTSAVIISALLANRAFAQCQHGAGGATTTSTVASTGTAFPTISLANSAELARQQMQQAYLRQMQLAYMQAAYMQRMQQAYQQQQAVAQEKQAKRQKRLDYWRERREAEIAQREAARQRNLLRYGSSPSLFARK